MSRRIVEAKLLDIVRHDLLTDEAFEVFHNEYRKSLSEPCHAAVREAEVFRQRLSQLERSIANMISAITAGTFSPAPQSALETAEAERANSAKKKRSVINCKHPFKSSPAFNRSTTSRRATRRRSRISDQRSRKTLNAPARSSGICSDRSASSGKAMVFMQKKTGDQILMASGVYLSLVAGAGFEPTTFGL